MIVIQGILKNWWFGIDDFVIYGVGNVIDESRQKVKLS
jgi:hypothetical protein